MPGNVVLWETGRTILAMWVPDYSWVSLSVLGECSYTREFILDTALATKFVFKPALLPRSKRKFLPELDCRVKI